MTLNLDNKQISIIYCLLKRLKKGRGRTIKNNKLYEARAEVASALSHPLRLKIVDILATEEKMCVQDFTYTLEASQSSISKHLKILLQVGILRRKSEGIKNYYFLNVPCITEFFSCLDQVLKENYQRKKDSFDLI